MNEFESSGGVSGPAHAVAQAAAGCAAAAHQDALDREIAGLDRSLALAGVTARALVQTLKAGNLTEQDARGALALTLRGVEAADEVVALIERWWLTDPADSGPARQWCLEAPETVEMLHRFALSLRGRLSAAAVMTRTRLGDPEPEYRAAVDAAVERALRCP